MWERPGGEGQRRKGLGVLGRLTVWHAEMCTSSEATEPGLPCRGKGSRSQPCGKGTGVGNQGHGPRMAGGGVVTDLGPGWT